MCLLRVWVKCVRLRKREESKEAKRPSHFFAQSKDRIFCDFFKTAPASKRSRPVIESCKISKGDMIKKKVKTRPLVQDHDRVSS